MMKRTMINCNLHNMDIGEISQILCNTYILTSHLSYLPSNGKSDHQGARLASLAHHWDQMGPGWETRYYLASRRVEQPWSLCQHIYR